MPSRFSRCLVKHGSGTPEYEACISISNSYPEAPSVGGFAVAATIVVAILVMVVIPILIGKYIADRDFEKSIRTHHDEHYR